MSVTNAAGRGGRHSRSGRRALARRGSQLEVSQFRLLQSTSRAWPLPDESAEDRA
jgi:hypothetical protein